MIRTFQSRVDKTMLFCCLLPSTVMAVFFFWVRLPLPALLFLLAMVFIVERLIHTTYTLTDEGILCISKGRFSRLRKVDVRNVDSVWIERSGWWRSEVVVVSFVKGAVLSLTPMAPKEFCQAVIKRRKELCEKEESLSE